MEAYASINDPASQSALWRVFERVGDKEARDLVGEVIAVLELALPITDGGDRLWALSTDRRFVSNQADYRKSGIKANPKLKGKKAPRPMTGEALEGRAIAMSDRP